MSLQVHQVQQELTQAHALTTRGVEPEFNGDPRHLMSFLVSVSSPTSLAILRIRQYSPSKHQFRIHSQRLSGWSIGVKDDSLLNSSRCKRQRICSFSFGKFNTLQDKLKDYDGIVEFTIPHYQLPVYLSVKDDRLVTKSQQGEVVGLTPVVFKCLQKFSNRI